MPRMYYLGVVPFEVPLSGKTMTFLPLGPLVEKKITLFRRRHKTVNNRRGKLIQSTKETWHTVNINGTPVDNRRNWLDLSPGQVDQCRQQRHLERAYEANLRPQPEAGLDDEALREFFAAQENDPRLTEEELADLLEMGPLLQEEDQLETRLRAEQSGIQAQHETEMERLKKQAEELQLMRDEQAMEKKAMERQHQEILAKLEQARAELDAAEAAKARAHPPENTKKPKSTAQPKA